MPMTGPTFAANIFQEFTGAGFIGTDSINLANAIGIGGMAEIVGKAFDTTDGPGTAANPGTGAGVGLTLVVGAIVSLQIQQEIVILTGLPPQPDMISMADAIGDSFETETGLALLASSHSPMFAGPAIITPGSIAVVGADIGDSIESAAPTFVGNDWPDFAGAFGNALADSLLLASGNITVTGVPPGTPVAFPLGPNLISPAGVLA